MDNKKIKASINLAGRNIPLTIRREYESIVRAEVKRANRDFQELKEKYDFKNEIDALLTFLLMELADKAVLKLESSRLEEQCKKALETIKQETDL